MFRLLFFIVLLGAGVNAFSADKAAATYLVSVESWAPYWLVKDEAINGIFSDLMRELDQQVEIDLVPIQPLPIKRAKILFNRGEIQIECCVNTAWRQSSEDLKTSLWSNAVMTAEEILIFPKGKGFAFEGLPSLKGKSLATMLGYGYVGSEYFKRNDTVKNTSLIKMVAAGRVDGGIMDRVEYAYAINNYKQLEGLKSNIDLGPVINLSELKLRVHASRPDLASELNAALAELKNRGVIEALVRQYTQNMAMNL